MGSGRDNSNYKHGGYGTRIYKTWAGMMQRCFNENAPKYKYYGGRGIYVEDVSWLDFIPFRDWALANGYSDNLTIDRIDNNRGYYPENCQWITNAENRSKEVRRRWGNQYGSGEYVESE